MTFGAITRVPYKPCGRHVAVGRRRRGCSPRRRSGDGWLRFSVLDAQPRRGAAQEVSSCGADEPANLECFCNYWQIM